MGLMNDDALLTCDDQIGTMCSATWAQAPSNKDWKRLPKLLSGGINDKYVYI